MSPFRIHNVKLPGQACAIIFLMLTSQVGAEPPLRAPDGAPGENRPQDASDEVFAQAPGGPRLLPKKPDKTEEQTTESGIAPKPDELNEKLTLDSVDFRAPFNKAKQAAWQKIESAAEQHDWNRLYEQLDRFAGPIDQPPDQETDHDLMVLDRKGHLTSSHLRIAQLLAGLPAEVRNARTRQIAAVGRRLIDDALQSGNIPELNRLAARLFGTPAGYRAADRLVARLVDSGDFALADRWLTLLRHSDATFVEASAWKKRADLVSSIVNSDSSERPTELVRQLISDRPESLDQWPVPSGNSRRHAQTASADRPVMIRRWAFETTSNVQLRRSVTELIDELKYRGTPAIPAGVPLLVNGRIVVRTFRGIEVLDSGSGRHQWTASERASVERLLGSARKESQSDSDLLNGMSPLLSANAAVDRTGGPIGQFLFQNAAHGLISSDGETVYFLEDDPVFTLGRTSIRTTVGRDASPGLLSATSNRLRAVDLVTGQPTWQIGGPETRELFQPALAGWFFLGTPLPDRGDLFIVGQKENEIRLFCLDPQTGTARWSQLLAWSEEELERNLNRRLWSIQVAVSHGVVVCPTTVGWLVGVDRSTGTLLWAHRYSDRSENEGAGTPGLFRANRGPVDVANTPIGQAWVPSAPIIAGDRIFFSPSEPLDDADRTTELLDCINLFTGERLWSQPRGDSLYVTGLQTGRAAVIGGDGVTVLDRDGSVAAFIEYGNHAGQPGGRGVIADDTIWLPLMDGTVICVDIEKECVTERLELPPRHEPLGNLAFYNGMLISHALGSITAWELERTVTSRLASVRESGNFAEADLLEARLSLTKSDYQHAITLLISRLSTTPETRIPASIQDVLVRAAFALLQSDAQSCLELLEQLKPLTASGQIALQRQALTVEALLRLQRFEDAFRLLLDVAANDPSGTMNRIDDPAVSVSIDAWLRGLLPEVWSSVSLAGRQALDEPIRSILTPLDEAATPAERKHHSQLVEWFSFHPAAETARQSAIESGDRPDSDTLSGLLSNSSADSLDWGPIDLKMIRTGTATAHQSDVSFTNLAGNLGHLRIEANESSTGTGRLSFYDRRDDSLYWTATLRSGAGRQAGAGQSMIVHRTGNLFPVLYRGALNALSIADRKVVWTQRVERLDNSRRTRQQKHRPLQSVSDWMQRLRPGSKNALPVVNSAYICSRATRSISVFATESGKLLWKLDQVERGARVFGTLGTVYLTAADGTLKAAHRAIDGKPLSSEALAEMNGALVRINEDTAIFANADVDAETLVIEAQASGSSTSLWRHEFSNKVKLGPLASNQLVIMASRGRCQILDLTTGNLQPFDAIPVRLRLGNPDFTVFSDGDLVYVVLTRDSSVNTRAPGPQSLLINGHLIAFDPSTGTQKWDRELLEQHLIVEKLDQLPFLIAMSHSHEFLLTPSDRRHIIVIDRRDGTDLINASNQPGQGGFHTILVDPRAMHVDLLSSSERLRLQARVREEDR